MVVLHSFEECEDTIEIEMLEAGKEWKIIGEFHREGISARLCGGRLLVSSLQAYDGAVILLA